jgi:single-strand DNA-binding protein
MMNLNLVVLAGRLAAPPEVRSFESGSRLARYLVTVRSERPRRRVDVVPVTLWDPDEELIENLPEAGAGVWVAGSVQRRFWTRDEGRRSRLEVVAQDVQIRDPEESGEPATASE